MEERAYSVLQKNFVVLKSSNMDPAWLAGKLLAAGIIGLTEHQRACNSAEIAEDRLGKLIENVMRSGAPDVFQTFVTILLCTDHVKYLGQKLKCTHDFRHLYSYTEVLI